MDIGLRDAARILKVSEGTLSRWVEDEGLPAFIINGRYKFNRVDLLQWANHRKLPTEAFYELASDSLALYALLEGNIYYDVPAGDLNAAMTAVAERLPLPSARDKALAAQALAERESVGSTGIGDGIAIPHTRSPLIFPLERPAVALCFMANAVPFGAPDAKPVGILWAIISPTIRVHLALLARVAAALQDAPLRKLLVKRRPPAEILARLKELP